MGRLFAIAFLALPLIEIATFIKVGQAIGIWPTLLGVVASAFLGVLVIRAQGLSLLQQIRATVGRGQLPAQAITEAMMVFFAGVLLLIPGYFTDFVALLLLLSPVREALYFYLRGHMVVVATPAGSGQPYRPRVENGTIDLDEDDYRKR